MNETQHATGREGKGRPSGAFRWSRWISLAMILLLVGCYPSPYRAVPETSPRQGASVRKPPSTQVFFYPRQGQTTEQQSRDHYECYNWAISQTGFDPGQSAIPTEKRVRVVPMPPPGYDTATLAIAGAVIGALIGGPRHAAGGALIGGASGAFIGAASDASRQETARQIEESYASREPIGDAALEAKAAGFRRAMSACLEGRGYSVR